MKSFTYKDIEFTDLQQVKTYAYSFFEHYGEPNFDLEAASIASNEFHVFMYDFITKMLHRLTLEMNPHTDEYGELQDEIVALAKVVGFFSNDIDSETIEYDLEKSWANVIRYFKDYNDESILYAMEFINSPYQDYDENEIRFYAVRKIQKVVTAYEEIEPTYEDEDEE